MPASHGPIQGAVQYLSREAAAAAGMLKASARMILYHIMLCHVMSCYVIILLLYYITLHYITLYYVILYYTILYYTILYYTILYYTIVYDIVHRRPHAIPPPRSCGRSPYEESGLRRV